MFKEHGWWLWSNFLINSFLDHHHFHLEPHHQHLHNHDCHHHHRHNHNDHLGESMTWSCRNPFLVEVVVDHHRGTSGRYALLRTLVTEKAQIKNLKIEKCHCESCKLCLNLVKVVWEVDERIKWMLNICLSSKVSTSKFRGKWSEVQVQMKLREVHVKLMSTTSRHVASG